ncbi:immunoglobulin-like domain-containing protein [Listeria cornellensis]|uniref:Putative peptidoglycan linked protein n=1 Tax=Listeria cornellensis FSL F6-0969 TaxID=1265820 RepID=W7BKI5_9LIST|nr:immunoglobulin-like domain-containing protein [Listeria cornellensis]EUJ25300.1 putative peptidoglycan linked protein [Listeria cornellensis FSL F6-0969]
MKKKLRNWGLTFLVIFLMSSQSVSPLVAKAENSGMEANSKPVITAENRVITKNENFQPLMGISAFDEEDGDITERIEVVSNNVNIAIPGVYSVLYRVTDSTGLVGTKLATITVVAATNHKPIIHAQNQIVEAGKTFNTLDNVTVMDEEDGDITHRLTVLSSNVNTEIPGVYSVLYSVTDFGGAKSTEQITVTVVEASDQKPILYAQDQIVHQNTSFNALKGVTAYDKEDGDLTGKIVVLSNNVNTDKLGVYEVLYMVTDSKGAQTSKWISVTVQGATNQKPIIYAQNQTVEQNAQFDVMNNVTAIDLEDGNMTARITVQQNTVNTEVLGTYMVVYTVVDSQNESTTKNVWITVIPKIVSTTIERVMDTDTSVSGTGEAGESIEIRSGTVVIANGQVGSDGYYHFVIEKQPEGAIIKAIVTKLSTGQTSHASTRVEKFILIDKPSIGTNPVYDVTTQVTGFAQSPARKVRAHWNGFIIGEATVDDNGSFVMDIPALMANQTITFIAQDNRGNSSEPYIVIIKAATIMIH